MFFKIELDCRRLPNRVCRGSKLSRRPPVRCTRYYTIVQNKSCPGRYFQPHHGFCRRFASLCFLWASGGKKAVIEFDSSNATVFQDIQLDVSELRMLKWERLAKLPFCTRLVGIFRVHKVNVDSATIPMARSTLCKRFRQPRQVRPLFFGELYQPSWIVRLKSHDCALYR